MKKLLLLFVIFLSSVLHAEESVRFDKVYGVVAGVLRWQNPGLSSFEAHNRLDLKLVELLIDNGVVSANLSVLIDEKATLAGIRKEIERIAAVAPADSTFLFYYTGHGMNVGGQIYLANYDIDPNSPGGSGLTPQMVAESIAAKFKGKTVLLFADCCYSGGLEDAAAILKAKGYRVLVIASSDRSNISTGSWQFTKSLIDCLSGAGLADWNGDGWVSLDEMRTEIAEAMKYMENQKIGYANFGMNAGLRISKVTAPIQITTSSGFSIGQYVMANCGGADGPARITAFDDDKAKIEFLAYSDTVRDWQPVTTLRSIQFRSYPVGSEVYVEWEGKFYDAKILKVEDGFHYVTYPGWDESWNEWVMNNRIADSFEAILVEWEGEWYPAKIFKREGDQCFIHYLNYGNEWDEWVGSDRMRRVP